MKFKLDWEPGKTVTNKEIMEKFKCAMQGGMRRSLKTNTLVLVSDFTHNMYENAEKSEDNIWSFSGMGFDNQLIDYKQNKTLFNSFKEDVRLFLFLKKHTDIYEFVGEVINLGTPIVNEYTSENGVKLQKIFFQLIELGNSKNPSEFFTELGEQALKDEQVLQSNSNQLDLNGLEKLQNLMIKYGIDSLLNRSSWFFSKSGYFINRFDSNKENKIKNIHNDDLNRTSVYYKQNKFINPFSNQSLVQELSDKDLQLNFEKASLTLGTITLNLDYLSTNLELFNLSEIEKPQKNRKSTIIGKNGVGKSSILSSIQKIFLDLINLSNGITEKFTKKINYSVKYKIGSDIYYVKKERLKYLLQKNDKEINFNYLRVPSNIITSSLSYNDKFTSTKNIGDSNSYIGFKVNSGKNLNKIMINNIINGSLKDSNFVKNLKKITDFLEFQSKIKIELKLKNKQIKLINQYINLINQDNNYKSAILSNITKNEYEKQNAQIDFLDFYKEISSNNDSLNDVIRFNNNNTLEILFDLSSDYPYEIIFEKFETIQKYINDEIFANLQIKMIKDVDWVSLEEYSSGEFQYIFTMINILAKLQENSLILIDEPETSFHPNWQFKYMTLLEQFYSDYKNFHFIFATHSHFIISDLSDDDTTSLIKLEKVGLHEVNSTYIDQSTYGKSAEDLLYEIFDLPTNRNYYMAKDIDKILKAISTNAISEEIKSRMKKLMSVREHLNDLDPLKELINKLYMKVFLQ